MRHARTSILRIRRGAWLRWAYENLPERDYLNTLRAVRADQRAEARRGN